MNTAYKWLVLILLFAVPAFSQNVRVDNVAFSSVQGFPFLPGATITICTAAGAGLPCTPTVAGTCLSISDAVCNQSATLTSDTFGNYGFWIQPGSYTYTITKAGFGGFGPKALTLAVPSAGSGPGTFTNLTVSGTNPGLTTCLFNNLFVVGSSCYANIAAAQTAAGVTGGILIPANYTGTDVYSNPNASNTILDLRGGTSLGGIPTGIQIGGCPQTGMTGTKPQDNGNTCFGSGVMSQDSIGYDDTAFGLQAMQQTTVACCESAFGRGALSFDTYGRFNTALGYGSMRGNVSGSFNTFVGEFAEGNTTVIGGSLPGLFADLNTGIGAGVLLNLTSGADNNSLGEASSAALTTGTLNTAVGSSALNALTTGTQNTAVGNTALFALRPTSAAISAFSNPGGGFVQATSTNHGLSNGNTVVVSGSTVQIPSPAVIPLLTQNGTGGSLGAATYFVKITLFSNNYCAGAPPCETLSSPETSIVVASGTTNQVIVTRPVLRPTLADGFCVYASTTTGTETKQGCETGFSFPLNLPGTFTINSISAGAAVPGSNGTAGNNYNGTYSITVVDANNFKFTATFVGTQSGSTCAALNPCPNAWWQLNSTPAQNNTALGYGAGNGVTTGSQNTLIGSLVSASTGITTGSLNTCLGFSTCNGVTTGSGNTVIGAQIGGLAAGLTNNVILSDGNGSIRAQHDGTSNGWKFNNGIGLTGGALFASTTVPTIAAAGCGGAAASIVVANGTMAFKVNVGTTPGSACTLTFPAATTGWNVTCNDITTQSTSVFVQKQTGVESTTSVTITNFNDVAVATAFVASDILKCTAAAD